MKNVIFAALLAVGLTSNAFAHHNANSDNAGGNMSPNSAHLQMVFE